MLDILESNEKGEVITTTTHQTTISSHLDGDVQNTIVWHGFHVEILIGGVGELALVRRRAGAHDAVRADFERQQTRHDGTVAKALARAHVFVVRSRYADVGVGVDRILEQANVVKIASKHRLALAGRAAATAFAVRL